MIKRTFATLTAALAIAVAANGAVQAETLKVGANIGNVPW